MTHDGIGDLRYHLREFDPTCGALLPQNAKELFNYRHSQARTTVERAIGIIKRRFRPLRHNICAGTIEKIRHIVYACFILNNLLTAWGDPWDQDDYSDDEEDETAVEDIDDPPPPHVDGGESLRSYLMNMMWNEWEHGCE